MNWKVEIAKNGQYTLKVNDYYLYSRYDPCKDAMKFIDAETDTGKSYYLLIGVGLGYHLESLLNLTTTDQCIYVYFINENEKLVFEKYGKVQLYNNRRIKFVNMEQIPLILLKESTQIIIPLPWMKIMEDNNPLFDVLDDIKTRQMSNNTYVNDLYNNFQLNLTNNDQSINCWKKIL